MLLFLGFGHCVLAPGPPTVPGMGAGARGMGAAAGCMPPEVDNFLAPFYWCMIPFLAVGLAWFMIGLSRALNWAPHIRVYG